MEKEITKEVLSSTILEEELARGRKYGSGWAQAAFPMVYIMIDSVFRRYFEKWYDQTKAVQIYSFILLLGLL